MDVSLLIRQRLGELGLEQTDLAAAVEVTDSYISQLLARKKAPPAPGRTDLYEKIGDYLNLPSGELARLAEFQRKQELKRKLDGTPAPLLAGCRELILRKCEPARRAEIQLIFEKETFGELERLVTSKVLDVAQGLARDELRNEKWLRLLARASGRSYAEMRVTALEFLDAGVLDVSKENCVSFLDPMIEYWDIDLRTFRLEIALNHRLSPRSIRRFEFVEVQPEAGLDRRPPVPRAARDARRTPHPSARRSKRGTA